MLANWIRQRVLAGTSDDVLLGAPVDSFVGCSNVFTNDGLLHYSIEDGMNRETGIGTYIQSTNKLVRDTPFETLIDGVYNKNVVSPMTITNESIVSVTATVRGLTTHTPVWKDLLGDFTQNPGTHYLSPDVKSLSGNVETHMFSDNLVESLGVRFALPHDIKVGEAMFPHFRWSPNTTSTGVVRWGIEFMIAELDTGVFINTTTLYLEQAGSGTLNKLQVAEAASQIIAGSPNTLIIGRVFRDSTHINDTFVGDAALHVTALHFQSDALGTPARKPAFYTWG